MNTHALIHCSLATVIVLSEASVIQVPEKKKQFLIDYRSTVILKRIILKTY